MYVVEDIIPTCIGFMMGIEIKLNGEKRTYKKGFQMHPAPPVCLFSVGTIANICISFLCKWKSRIMKKLGA